jgi:hypothetical protein
MVRSTGMNVAFSAQFANLYQAGLGGRENSWNSLPKQISEK